MKGYKIKLEMEVGVRSDLKEEVEEEGLMKEVEVVEVVGLVIPPSFYNHCWFVIFK